MLKPNIFGGDVAFLMVKIENRYIRRNIIEKAHEKSNAFLYSS